MFDSDIALTACVWNVVILSFSGFSTVGTGHHGFIAILYITLQLLNALALALNVMALALLSAAFALWFMAMALDCVGLVNIPDSLRHK